MNYFRCFSCWRPLGYSGPKSQMVCPACEALLSVNPPLREGPMDGNDQEYYTLAGKLYEILAQDRGIAKGQDEIIAGPDVQYMPSAIYYSRNEKPMLKPMIYEIVTSPATSYEVTVKRCRLFVETAQNLFSYLNLVVPRDIQGAGGEELVLKMFKENEINTERVRIMTL